MKNLCRYACGVLSSLLFVVGFSRAAAQLDPMSLDLAPPAPGAVASASVDCVNNCNLLEG